MVANSLFSQNSHGVRTDELASSDTRGAYLTSPFRETCEKTPTKKRPPWPILLAWIHTYIILYICMKVDINNSERDAPASRRRE